MFLDTETCGNPRGGWRCRVMSTRCISSWGRTVRADWLKSGRLPFEVSGNECSLPYGVVSFGQRLETLSCGGVPDPTASPT